MRMRRPPFSSKQRVNERRDRRALACYQQRAEQRHRYHYGGEPKFLAANLATIDAKDMVIAVTLGGESRAYPIREMGYHHIVNDRLRGLPLVVTY